MNRYNLRIGIGGREEWAACSRLDAANLKFVQHLFQTFLPGSGLFGALDPSDVIVLLVSWTGLIVLHQVVLLKCIPDVIRHFVLWPPKPRMNYCMIL